MPFAVRIREAFYLTNALLERFIKCSEKCARRDWSERVHYISIKTRALSHKSALLRYNAQSLGHRYERAQLTIHFIKEIKKLVPRALLSYISTWEFLRTLEKCVWHLPSDRASPHISRVLKNSRVVI